MDRETKELINHHLVNFSKKLHEKLQVGSVCKFITKINLNFSGEIFAIHNGFIDINVSNSILITVPILEILDVE